MIRAIAPGKDGPVVILGVTRENVARLMIGYPIAVDLAEFGEGVKHLGGDPSKITFSILYGEQHENIVEQLAEVGIEMPEGMAHEASALDRRLAKEDDAALRAQVKEDTDEVRRRLREEDAERGA